MVGIKGRSGRRSEQDEKLKARVIDKAWMKAEKMIDGHEFSNQTASLAQAIVVKSMPSIVGGDADNPIATIVSFADVNICSK